MLQPKLPLDSPDWIAKDEVKFAYQFVYKNTVSADTLLFAARCVSIALTLVLAFALALWTRRRFGPAVSLSALALCCFDPNLIAHGRYITSDLIVTLFFFLAIVAWGEYLIGGRPGWLIASGITLGLAIASKFSAVVLVPIFVVLYLIRCWQKLPRTPVMHALRSFLAVSVLAYFVIALSYWPEARAFVPGIRRLDRSMPPARSTILGTSPTAASLRWFSTRLGLGSNAFFDGLVLLASHNDAGQESYLLGRRSDHGWWYYFPLVMLVKSPTGLLLGLAASGWFIARRFARTRLRTMPMEWFLLAVPPLIYFAFAMTSKIDLGVRHLLPIFPFLFILISAVLWQSGQRVLLTLVVAIVAIESVWVFPSYLAFFNLPSGGPGNGSRYLVDSNLDWGQDLRRLTAYVNQHGRPQVCVCYFGSAPVEYYGLDTADLARGADAQPPDCLAAISVTPLMGVYVGDGWSWLRKYRPDAKIGYSIYVYDFRKKKLSDGN